MSTADAASDRTESALKAGGYADMRPVYREVLRRIRQREPAAFEEATKRYEETLVPALSGGEEDPVAVWTTYGAWLAGKLAPGRVVRLDESGLALEAEPRPVPGQVLLYLPDEQSEPAIALVRPSDPSSAQKAALELLTR